MVHTVARDAAWKGKEDQTLHAEDSSSVHPRRASQAGTGEGGSNSNGHGSSMSRTARHSRTLSWVEDIGDEGMYHEQRGLHTRLMLGELKEAHHMRRRVFLDETKSARSLLQENQMISSLLEDIKKEQFRWSTTAMQRQGAHGVAIPQDMTSFGLVIQALIIDPRSKFKNRWDLGIALLVLGTVVAIPLQIAFDEEIPGEFSLFSIILTSCDAVFLADSELHRIEETRGACLTLRSCWTDTHPLPRPRPLPFPAVLLTTITGFINDANLLIKSHSQIFKAYAKGWLFFDLASSIPFSYLFHVANPSSTDTDSGGVLALKFLRLIKVLRIIRLFKPNNGDSSIIARLKEYINPSARTLLMYVVWLFYAWHLLGCIYWRVAYPPGASPWSPDISFENATTGEQCTLRA
jgi:hypothetical protein